MKIPDSARTVFTGTIFSVHQWDQELFDGSMATFEMLSRADTVQVIPVLGEDLMLVRESQPHFSERCGMVGGIVDPGEEPLDAAKRELLEETGMVADEWDMLFVFDDVPRMSYATFVYVARGCKKVSEQHLEPGERITPITVPFDEFISICSRRDFRNPRFTMEMLYARLEGLGVLRERIYRSDGWVAP